MEGQNGRDYSSWWFAALWIGVKVLGLAGMAAAWQTHTGAPITLTFSVKQLEVARV